MRINEFKAELTKSFARRGCRITSFGTVYRVTYPTGNRGVSAEVTDDRGCVYLAEIMITEDTLIDLFVRPKSVDRLLSAQVILKPSTTKINQTGPDQDRETKGTNR